MNTSSSFDEIGRSLSPQDRAELFQVLHEADFGPDDRVLAKLLRALQIYKTFYEQIPTRCARHLRRLTP
jgi:hypothetical protein